VSLLAAGLAGRSESASAAIDISTTPSETPTSSLLHILHKTHDGDLDDIVPAKSVYVRLMYFCASILSRKTTQ
jgi:hypothetical protein